MVITPMRVRPDGHGIWTDGGRTVGFFLEYDLATEPLTVLIEKIARYTRLDRYKRRAFVVLFWLPTARRERNLHQRLADLRDQALPFATAAADHATLAGLCPAEAVWWLHGAEGPRVRLGELPSSGYHPADLATGDADDDDDPAVTAKSPPARPASAGGGR